VTASDPAADATALHAHEFHYSSLHNLPADTRYAYAVRRGHGIDGSTTASCCIACSPPTRTCAPPVAAIGRPNSSSTSAIA
jgi:cobyrinic acid a,c-diamide synthase